MPLLKRVVSVNQGQEGYPEGTLPLWCIPPPPCVTFRRVVVSLRGPGQSPVVPSPPPPRVTFRRVVVSLRGPGQSPVLPFACCVGSQVLTAAACGAPAGVISAFVEPSGWCAGAVLDVARCAVRGVCGVSGAE